MLGWKPSHENARPNGDPLHAALVFGNGAIWEPAGAAVRSESKVAFKLTYAQPRAVASLWMNASYAVSMRAYLAADAG